MDNYAIFKCLVIIFKFGKSVKRKLNCLTKMKLKIFTYLRKILSDKSFSKLGYYYLHIRSFRIPKLLNLESPMTFNEKIIHLKLNNRFKDANLLVDKYEVRKYITQIIGDKYLIPLIGAYDNVDEIDFKSLPKQCVIKANQSSGDNILVKNINELDVHDVKEKLKKWLQIDYSTFGEWQYKGIKNKVIIEKYIYNTVENPLLDYKFFCFNGKPKYVQVDVDRETNHTRKFYDLEWNPQEFTFLYPRPQREIKRPKNLETMIQLVSKISEDLKSRMDFVRIDFYDHNNEVFFGEITFHPEGGSGPILPKKFDLILGSQLEL